MKVYPDDSGARNELAVRAANDSLSDGSATPRHEQFGVSARPALDFVDVYRQHFGFACRSLRLLGVEPSSLEDAAQEVFGTVLRRLPEFAGNSSLETWIFAIVQRVAANQRRSRKRKPSQPLIDDPEASDASPEQQAEALQAAVRVQAFCDGLDEDRRALFVLALIEGVPARELAPSLGVPLFTVYSRIRSLRAALDRFLKMDEVSS